MLRERFRLFWNPKKLLTWSFSFSKDGWMQQQWEFCPGKAQVTFCPAYTISCLCFAESCTFQLPQYINTDRYANVWQYLIYFITEINWLQSSLCFATVNPVGSASNMLTTLCLKSSTCFIWYINILTNKLPKHEHKIEMIKLLDIINNTLN